MKIKTKKDGKEKYLLLKENESITILADKELKSAVNIMCKNKKLFINFTDELERTEDPKKRMP